MLHLGTLIHGTLRSVDLLQAFAGELERHTPLANAELIAEAYAKVEAINVNPDCDDEEASEIVNELQDKLDDVASAYGLRFGNTEGDGSDFGFWEVEND